MSNADEMNLVVGKIGLSPRRRPNMQSRYWRSEMKEFEQHTRVYFSPEGETIWDNLANRRRRPHQEYRRMMPTVFERTGIEPVKFRWSKHAGCRMCPCSPGMILERTLRAEDGYTPFDIWVQVIGEIHPDDYDPEMIAVQVMGGMVVTGIPAGTT